MDLLTTLIGLCFIWIVIQGFCVIFTPIFNFILDVLYFVYLSIKDYWKNRRENDTD